MREMSLEEIRQRVRQKGTAIDHAVNRFRIMSREQGWTAKRNRPRHPDEVKALDRIARQTMLEAIKNGQVVYDKEKRVLCIERLEKL